MSCKNSCLSLSVSNASEKNTSQWKTLKHYGRQIKAWHNLLWIFSEFRTCKLLECKSERIQKEKKDSQVELRSSAWLEEQRCINPYQIKGQNSLDQPLQSHRSSAGLMHWSDFYSAFLSETLLINKSFITWKEGKTVLYFQVSKIAKYYSDVVLRKTQVRIFETVPQTMVYNKILQKVSK